MHSSVAEITPLPSPAEDFWVRDESLWEEGKEKVRQSLWDMPGLVRLAEVHGRSQPLAGCKITGCVSVTYETANFVLLLAALGADLRWCADNRFATRDDAAAFLAHKGIPVFAKSGETEKEFEWCMDQALAFRDEDGRRICPDLIVDDGADISKYMYQHYRDLARQVSAVSEQTTCGIHFFAKRERQDELLAPVINVNDSVVKSKFDNHYGIKESLIAGMYNSGFAQIGGKRVVLAGYGEVGKGAAFALKGIGAKVYITEINAVNLLLAHMDGFEVTTMDEACSFGDIFITATGCIGVIEAQHMRQMKDGALLVNIGHGNEEFDVAFLEENPEIERQRLNQHSDAYVWPDGRKTVVLTGGYLNNMLAAKGNPPRVMSLTFTNHTLGLLSAWKDPSLYRERRIHDLPLELNEISALLNFPEIADKLTELTETQAEYLGVVRRAHPTRHLFDGDD